MIVQFSYLIGAEMVTGLIEFAKEAAFDAVVIEADHVGAGKIVTTVSDLADVFGSDVAAFQVDQLRVGQIMHSELDQLARILQIDIHESHLKQPALVDIVESELFHLADERRIRGEAETAAAHSSHDGAYRKPGCPHRAEVRSARSRGACFISSRERPFRSSTR